MPLLNYTTTVAASKTIGQVQQLLVKGGARGVLSEYDEKGDVTALSFVTETPYGMQRFHLPVNTEKVHTVLNRWDSGVPGRFQTKEHAQRVAWRILKDWLEAQLAIIETEMVTFDQVMLPYMQTKDGGTVYEMVREQQLALNA